MKTHKTLAVVALLATNLANAVPSVDVSLRTSFPAPPYLLELLETAAEENSTAYHPLLDRIANGYFDGTATEQSLYTKFRNLLQQDGHLSRADLSSFDLAMSLHSAAPRIEAHFQYYNTTVRPRFGDDGCESCWAWVPSTGKRFCSPDMDSSTGTLGAENLHQLPFDRVLGSGIESVLYADITSQAFRKFHETLSKTAREGKTSYRVRYVPTKGSGEKVAVGGYGVGLALKRTDYIVIDDRQTEGKEESESAAQATLSEEEVSDLRPLSSSELARLGLKAASFVMASEQPLDTLVKLSQDFPKHSSAIAAVNVSSEFLNEHRENREIVLPPGFSGLWINGVQVIPREIDPYALLEHMRRERRMVDGARKLGLTASQTIDLISHDAISKSSSSQDVPRFDWRDDIEGGKVIIWLNNVEKDKRYSSYPTSINALLQRTFPGQLPPVRRDIHNVIMPIDFSDYEDVTKVVSTLSNFIQRDVPVRFGLVPRTESNSAAAQAKIVYYLLTRYGLSTMLGYLEVSIEEAKRKFGPPQEKSFNQAISDRQLRKKQTPMGFADILTSPELDTKLAAAEAYLTRLNPGKATPPVLANGVAVSRSEWLQEMSERVTLDLRMVQRMVFEGQLAEDTWIPELFLANAARKRNPLLMPDSDDSVKHVDLCSLAGLEGVVKASGDTVESELVHLVVVADLGSEGGFAQYMEGLLFRREHDNVEVAVVDTGRDGVGVDASRMVQRYDVLADEMGGRKGDIYRRMFEEVERRPALQKAGVDGVVSAIGLAPGYKALLINGRVVGPLPMSEPVDGDDLETLLSYERKKRHVPALTAIQELGLKDKIVTALDFARLSNLMARAQVSDVPEGIFETAPSTRVSFYRKWGAEHTAIKVGDMESAGVQLVATIDPASEITQKWIPILQRLTEMDGVAAMIFLNPKERLEEIPIKRFYRYVLESKPAFDKDGSMKRLSAHFSGLPADALLNVGMDVPPAWLIAPEEAVYDLDNIKLSTLKGDANIEAVYELEHILIEGHSQDVTLNAPPRGAQLVLQTEANPTFAGTIIMANIGYFQFKANPGVYSLSMQKGRSSEIFKIDSAGTLGFGVVPGDNGTELALTSFRGVTLYPRLSRRPGMEEEDVLQPSASSLSHITESAEQFLSNAGLPGRSLLHKASQWLSKDTPTSSHADINIFSVASGHLYERMLNIMMVSVMKHTTHSVKFWFIEQFLSPSFKRFLPTLSTTYNFQYEMVTYKWPHWLRPQKEKQREIWGYKILFLDVLFPLDLDKIIFVDADQIVRTDMYSLVTHNLHGAPYGFTPMCDSRTEMEGFRFWKQGYWKNFLRGLPYHISALYVVDLKKFRQMAAGDRLRQQYHQLSADPNSLSNLDQDLPNHMQMALPIHSLPQEWLWCETWCADEGLESAKTIDLCNNPLTKEPKLERARRQVPEWGVYDKEIGELASRVRGGEMKGGVQEGRDEL
ncbi:glycosyltransferase family 24 protein [Piedraia hortae CBS 480.64]|uniref:Glycosyltransferase family 24 protein n=1 Tax=Piedraia hortae CBS 480.64 TaxID=1314780 RepID=A0A6A7BVZ0_9PEZI|nr:glycosyltransferase family 24 protein [Piedraia hortae CBS 480.64]